MPQYNPCTQNRKVRPEFQTEDGIRAFVTKSFTSPSNEDRYHPTVDLATGEAVCDCPDFQYRRAKLNPTIFTPEDVCKHLQRVIANLKRQGCILD